MISRRKLLTIATPFIVLPKTVLARPGPDSNYNKNIVSGGTITTVFSIPSFSGDSQIAPGYSVRVVNAVGFASGPLGKVRVTLKTGSSASPGTAGITCDHVSIGVWSGSAGDTLAIPAELFFSGFAHGCQINTASATGTSDFTTSLTWLSTDSLVVIMDQGSVEAIDGAPTGSATVGTIGNWFFKAATASWNSTSSTGFTNVGPGPYGVMTIETQ